ncbi:MAG TPA: glycosyltransferase family 4 protein [Phycisphaerae bacterium]|nr:glycosyltransferase family 4 protein [Phycisphaerae bacterium]
MHNADGKPLRVALVHDWLTGMRGGEKVLAQLCELMGEADIFTLIHTVGACSETIESRRIVTSFLDKLPAVRRYYRLMLPLMPAAIEHLSIADYDLVISSSHCVAKGIGGRKAGQLHVSYCHTPMRYLWALQRDYDASMGVGSLALRLMRPALRSWDRRSASRVDHFIANSNCIARRIETVYGRKSDVLHPPVDVDFYHPKPIEREDFYLMVSALSPYKRVDHAIAACKKLNRPLKIIGTGQLAREITKASGSDVELLGWADDETVRDHYRRCRALLFPTLEDFGIVPVEAQSCGCPVIAFGSGGALDTVRDGGDNPTGVLYPTQTAESLADAIVKFEQLPPTQFDPQQMHKWAKHFSKQAFREGFCEILNPLFAERGWSI